MTETKNFRCALQLSGATLDIADVIMRYGANSDPAIHTMDGGDGKPVTFLTSSQLDLLSSATEVDHVAKRFLGMVNGVLFVMEPGRVPLGSGGIS